MDAFDLYICMGNHLNVRDTLVLVTGILHIVTNNNSNHRMCFGSIGIGVGMLYGFG